MHASSQHVSRRLRRELLSTIKCGGPLTVADFMRLVNTHPKYGYYSHQEVFGQRGDFITAPEISQLFGEITGAYMLYEFQSRFSHLPARPIKVVELGPGRGTLMNDILRTWAHVPAFFERIKQCVLVEKSEKLSQVQSNFLCSRYPSISFQWNLTVAEALHQHRDDSFTICFSNEFFDALPVHIFHHTSDSWGELLVDAIDVGDDAAFRFVQSPGPTAAIQFFKIASHHPPRDFLEVSPETSHCCKLISQHLSKHKGMFFCADYGSASAGDMSLRAIKGHRTLSSPLESVGEADLSVDVNFKSIASEFAEADFDVFGPVEQGAFLKTFGIMQRLAVLGQNASTAHLRDELESGVNRLVDKSQMGSAYKILTAASRHFTDCVPYFGLLAALVAASRVSAKGRPHRCPVYTYWQNIISDNDSHPSHLSRQRITLYDHLILLKIWARNWYSNGWEPRLLGLSEAQKNAKYTEFLNIVHQLPTVNPRSYEVACYVRWLALQQVGGGAFADYDILNFPIELIPKAAGQCGRGPLLSFPEYLPMLVFGDEMGIQTILDAFKSYVWSPDDLHKDKPHVSDMKIVQKLRQYLFASLIPNPKGISHFKTDYYREMLQKYPEKALTTPRAEWARLNALHHFVWNHRIFILVDDYKAGQLLPDTKSLFDEFLSYEPPSPEGIDFYLKPLRPLEEPENNVHVVNSIKATTTGTSDRIILLMEDPQVRVHREHRAFNYLRGKEGPVSLRNYLLHHSHRDPVSTAIGWPSLSLEQETLIIGLHEHLPESRLVIEYDSGVMLREIRVPYSTIGTPLASSKTDSTDGEIRTLIRLLNPQDHELYEIAKEILMKKYSVVKAIELDITAARNLQRS